MRRNMRKKMRKKMRKHALAISALVVSLTLLLAGCTYIQEQAPKEREPTFTPFTLSSPSPPASTSRTATPTPSLAPSPTPAASVNVTLLQKCVDEGQCVPGTRELYCENGVVVKNCGKCGCPEGTQCCRTSVKYGYYCAAPSLCIENWTGVGPGGTLEVVTPTPTPSPSPGARPCKTAVELNATTPNTSTMLSIIGVEYKKIFNKTVSWTQADANTFVFVDSSGDYNAETWFYVGRYAGWQPLDVLKEITNDSRPIAESLKCWREIAVNNENSPQQDPHYYWFKMPCFNWTYLIDARITERVDSGKWAQNYSKRFAQNLTNVCLE